MNIRRVGGPMRPAVRLFAGLMAVPGLFVGTICILDFVDHPSWRVVEWAVTAIALGLFFSAIAILGREP